MSFFFQIEDIYIVSNFFQIFRCIRFTKKDTTSLVRVFLKYLSDLFPRDNEENIDFSMKFFSLIDLED